MVPQIAKSAGNLSEIKQVAYPSFTFKVTEKRVEGFVDGRNALEQKIYHMWNTERYAYEYYPDSYGIELERYIGTSFSFVKSNIQKTLETATLQDDRCLGVTINSMTTTGTDKILIDVTVHTTLGSIDGGLTINV